MSQNVPDTVPEDQVPEAPRPELANIQTVNINGNGHINGNGNGNGNENGTNAPRKQSAGANSAKSPLSADSLDLEMDPMPYAGQTREIEVKIKRLVLCFDGTGNKFHGGEDDTNIIKIYQMLDKHDAQQYMYYQPGIGTYISGQHDFAPGFFARIKHSVRKSIDEAVGSSFDHHVLAGYSFIMRYYSPGDKIYIFGFSRGAYTARFLAQMVQNIGLLNRGNEELVPFAYKSFAKFERIKNERTDAGRTIHKHMEHFKNTFCRHGVRVYLLGLYDTVNSVGRFEMPLFRKTFPEDSPPAADHIRHAVAIDERRAKFKPYLYAQSHGVDFTKQDVKEVWFPGNHADIGGGWNIEDGRPLISDITLGWMIKEVIEIEDKDVGPQSTDRLNWDMHRIRKLWHSNRHAMGVATVHDALKFGGGWSRGATLSWWLIEVSPIFTRLELESGKWVPRHWPPNLGFTRDIPDIAMYHESVHARERAGVDYLPKNTGYIPCLKRTPAEIEKEEEEIERERAADCARCGCD